MRGGTRASVLDLYDKHTVRHGKSGAVFSPYQAKNRQRLCASHCT